MIWLAPVSSKRTIISARGHAVLCAHPVVGDEPVAVILPDVILDEYESDLTRDNLAEMPA
jgi:UTP--glucose-1-phosphate uridylyltransferase